MKKKRDKDNPFYALKDVKLKEESAQKRPPKIETPRVSKEDEELAFHRLVSGVTPLTGKNARVPVVDPVPRTARKSVDGAKASPEEASFRLLDVGKARFEVIDDGARAEGRVPDVAPDRMRKLRRGQLAIDARLDLHGMQVQQASEALTAFLKKMRAQGEKCVLVIHGKGRHTPGGTAVLRGEMSAWLSQGPASASVAAFASQQDPDGESGSMLVLLR